MTIKKTIASVVIFALLAACAATPPRTTPLFSEKKSAKVVIVSVQKNQRLQFRPNQQAIGLIPALVEEGVRSMAEKNAAPIIPAFNSRDIRGEMAESIRQKVQGFSGLKIDEIVLRTGDAGVGVVNEIENCKADLLVLIGVSTSLLPEQNVIQVETSVSIFDASVGVRTGKIDKPLQVILTQTQSTQFGIAYPQPTTTMIPKTPEKAAEEIAAIEARFRKEIANNPEKRADLEKQRDKEVRLSRSVKMTSEVRPTAVQALVKDNYQLFNRVYDELIPNAALATLAGLEDAWAMDVSSRKKEGTRFRRVFEDSTFGPTDGYVITKFSDDSRTMFRSLPSLGGPEIRIYSYPRINGAIFIGGFQISDLTDGDQKN